MLQAATSELPSATQIQYRMADVKLPNASPPPAKMQYYIIQIVCPHFPINVKSV